MTCTFYHNPLGCTVSYCYYSRNNEITCPVKKEHIELVGDFYKGSLDAKPLFNQVQQPKRYPKQY